MGVVTQATDLSAVSQLLTTLSVVPSRLVVMSAPPGYGKGQIVRAYADRLGTPIAVCDLPAREEPGDLARTVLDALIAGDRGRARNSAADRLAQRSEAAAAHSRDTLRREWAGRDEKLVFVVRDAFGLLATPAGAELFLELLATLPQNRTLVASTRIDLPPAITEAGDFEKSRLVTVADLALSRRDTIEIGRAAGLHPSNGRAVFDLTRGWPLVSRLLIHLVAQGDRIEDLASAARSITGAALLAFTAHRTIARLDHVVRDALVVATLMRRVTHPRLIRVLGDICDDVILARLTALPFTISSNDEILIHPEVAAVVRERFAALGKTLYERTLTAFTGEGAYVDAAHVALDRGDVTRAAAIVDAAPSYTATPVPLDEYEQIIDRMDRALITRFPNLWIATIPYRSFAVDRATHVREAETVYYCLPGSSNPDQRALALMLLCSAYLNAGRRTDTDRLLDEALSGFAREPSSARATLLNFSAWLRGMDGRFATARALAGEAAEISREDFSENQTLHYIDAHEAAHRGQNDRVIIIIDELLRRSDDLPLHRVNVAANGALFTWVNGDDASFIRYLDIVEDALTPGIERGFRPVVDGARGRPVECSDEFLWPISRAVAQLYRVGSATSDVDRLAAARAAAVSADERADPFVQILAHAALYVLDPGIRSEQAERLQALVRDVESEEMRQAVAALIGGKPAGILEPFLRRRVIRDRATPSLPPLTVELLSGRVTRGGTPVRLSDKEFEVLALLGASPVPLSRDRIGEALWDHLDPEEWPNNLKVTLSRLRTKVGARDTVLVVDGRYRLAPAILVDLQRAEAVVRECGGKELNETSRPQLNEIFSAAVSGTSGRYERFAWAAPLCARINELICSAGTLLAIDAHACGRVDEALSLATAVARIDPYDEAACELTLRILIGRGEIDAARREFRRYAVALSDELGAAPSARLVEMIRGSG